MIDKNGKAKDLQQRTKQFALRIIKLVRFLDKETVSRVIAKQILRSGTSVAANYRAACRSKSSKDFISKIGIVIEESDETLFWLEILLDAKLVKAAQLDELMDEANQITAIMVASKNSALKNHVNRI